MAEDGERPSMKIIAAIFIILFFGLLCWAISQAKTPEERQNVTTLLNLMG